MSARRAPRNSVRRIAVQVASNPRITLGLYGALPLVSTVGGSAFMPASQLSASWPRLMRLRRGERPVVQRGHHVRAPRLRRSERARPAERAPQLAARSPVERLRAEGRLTVARAALGRGAASRVADDDALGRPPALPLRGRNVLLHGIQPRRGPGRRRGRAVCLDAPYLTRRGPHRGPRTV